MSAQVLPKEVRLTAPPTMPQARSYLFKQQASQATYTPGSGNIQINIPRLQRSYLSKDSYLKFRISLQWQNSLAAADYACYPCFDTPGAYGLFDTIEVYDYLGSTLLERTSGHGQLMALLMDAHCNTGEMKNHFGAASGCKGNTVSFDPDTFRPITQVTGAAAELVLPFLKGKQVVTPPVSGASFGQTTMTTTGTAIATTNATFSVNNNNVRTYEFTVPLFSFLGSLSKKYAPLHNGYTINITLNTAANALGFASSSKGTTETSAVGPTTYTLSEIYFCSQVLELGPVAESMLISSTQGQPFVVPTKAYRYYTGQIAQSTQQYRLDLNLNVASLTNVLFGMRPTGTNGVVGNLQRKSLSYRIRNFLQNWYFQYGSTILPQTTGIQCRQPTGSVLDAGKSGYTEAYNEFMKARHNYSNANTHSMITADTYWVDNPTVHSTAYNDPNVNPTYSATADAGEAIVLALTPTALLPPGKFAGGLDLELVPGRSQDLICGMNTNGMNTSLFLNFDPTAAAASTATPGIFVMQAQLDAWCEYDAFVNISPGIATTVSF